MFQIQAVVAVAVEPDCRRVQPSRPAAGARPRTTGADSPIVVGAAVAKSGIMSQFDEPVVQGAQVAIAEVNKAGGVDGRKLKLVVADHKSDLNLVQQSALDVIDKGAKVVITTHDFDFGSPAAQVANSQGLFIARRSRRDVLRPPGDRPARLQPLSGQCDRGRGHGPVRPRPGLQAARSSSRISRSSTRRRSASSSPSSGRR